MRSHLGRTTAAISLAAAFFAPEMALADAMTGWSSKQNDARRSRYAELSTAAFERTVTVEDDDLEPIAKFTTEKGFRFKGGLGDTVRADSFLRAFVEKKTGKATFQLYATLTYTDPYRRFASANIASADGPISLPAAAEHHSVSCRYGACMSVDDVAFDVPERVIHEVAADADRRPVQPWRFRLKSQSGADWADDMAPAEAAGLLAAIDAWRAGRPK